ncbi:unnamed protein product [Meganyctiphanes norvegica]|uniref:C-type lectin n=1 Tax=Meganyctiphanes norvegica TaxID=48144 RepID=A0AAV2PKG5_MEGNR
MQGASITLLVLLSAAGCMAELPKSTPMCSKDWGGWWDAYHCGTYPLHWAVASGNMNLTKKLLNAGHDINQIDERTWTPIIEAAFFGKQHISVVLLRRGADLRAIGYRAINVVKMAKLKWCVGHSQVNTCPTTLYDYDRTIEVLFRGCEWTECEEGFRCVGRQCWPDKCHKVECATNASCVVENRKPVCRCDPGFVGEDPTESCEEISGGNEIGLETGNLVLDLCPEDFYIFGSQCLYIDDLKPVSWNGALNLCKKKKGVLAKIENPQNFSAYVDEFYPKMSFWLGGNDKKKEGVWRWYSGELLADDFPWGTNNAGKQQPNNGHNNEHCMTLKYFGPKRKTQYVDNRCTIKQYYVCEAPRNYVDEVSFVLNSVINTIENSSNINGSNHNTSINSNIANGNEGDNNHTDNEGESHDENNISRTGDNSIINRDNNNNNSINISDIESESSTDNSVTSGNNENNNISRTGEGSIIYEDNNTIINNNTDDETGRITDNSVTSDNNENNNISRSDDDTIIDNINNSTNTNLTDTI